MYLRILIVISILCCLSCRSKAPTTLQPITQTEEQSLPPAKTGFPDPVGFVNDFEMILSDVELAELTKLVVDFRKETGNQIAVVTIDSIGDYTNFDLFARDLSNAWGVGDKIKNNGLTMVVSQKLREVRISTGTGTQKSISNEYCSSVIANTMIPQFTSSKYYLGIKSGLLELMNQWRKSSE